MTEAQRKMIESLGLSESNFEPNAGTLEERIADLENRLASVTYTLNVLSESVTEVIKKDDSEMPLGDFLNPILIPSEGLTMEAGKFYYIKGRPKDEPHEAKDDAFVMPEDFDDRMWFDFV